MKNTLLMCGHGRYWVMNPIRITVAGKLRCRMMKYGSASTQGRLVHQIQGLPRSSIREMSACPVQWSKPRFVYSAKQKTDLDKNGHHHHGETLGYVAVRDE